MAYGEEAVHVHEKDEKDEGGRCCRALGAREHANRSRDLLRFDVRHTRLVLSPSLAIFQA